METITFEKATLDCLDTFFAWLEEPHIKPFWDNAPLHKQDIITFVEGRKTLSPYCGGKYTYWIARINNEPAAMLMTIPETKEDFQVFAFDNIKLNNLSRTGHTYGIDYMIGNKRYFGQGYGAKILTAFMDYFRDQIDPRADTFIIGAACDNPRAKHVYMRAGFILVGDFVVGGEVSGAGKPHHCLVKKFPPKVNLKHASLNDYPTIQNMGSLYVYDASRDCGFILPADGMYKHQDYKPYFEDPTRRAYIAEVNDEIAGFVLLNQVTTEKSSEWNIGEFFVIAKFQGCGVGKQLFYQIITLHPGIWEVSVLPENKSALRFWKNTILAFTDGHFSQETKQIDFDKNHPWRVIFTFATNSKHFS